jgi:arylsulfatase A-like enzyme
MNKLKPNLIFVLLDGARWDRLDISNEFSDLKKQGSLFNNITTSAPYTFASMNAIFTGLHGKENGVDSYYKMFQLKNSVNFLPELLKKNGYFTSCDLITEKVISSRGFDNYQSHDEYKDDLTITHPKFIKKCFEESKGEPTFIFLQFSRIHTVTVSEVLKKYNWDDKIFYENKNDNLKKYDEVFSEACRYAKIIKETIEEINQHENTIIIFFTDHGTGIGERFGERNYGMYLYEETVRTIYLFMGLGIPKNFKSDILLSTIDIFPTILDLCNINLEEKLPGTSFSSILKNNSIDFNKEKFSFSATGGLHGYYPSPEEPNVFSIKTTEYKLIYFKTPNKWELFNLKDDPLETENLHGKNLEIENTLKKELLDWINR